MSMSTNFLIAYPDAKKKKDEYIITCPLHDDHKPSCSVNLEKEVFYCFVCRRGGVLSELPGMKNQKSDFFSSPPKKIAKVCPANETIYTYTDEEGEPLHRVLRYDQSGCEKKIIQQGKPNGHWENSLKDIELVLYNLPALLSSDKVLLVEGEKCAEALNSIGYVATCCAGGAGAWKEHYADFLVGKEVIILPDNDAPGRDFAEAAKSSLRGKAKCVWIRNLPGLKEKEDVFDFLKNPENHSLFPSLLIRSEEELIEAAKELQDEEPSEKQESKPKEKTFSKLEKLVAFLYRKNGEVDANTCREHLGEITKQYLNKLFQQDLKGLHQILRRKSGRMVFLSIRKEEKYEVVSLDDLPDEETPTIAAYLPSDLSNLLGTYLGGLPPNSFFGVCGYGDHGKTSFLINLAIENAVRGKKVLFLRHEVCKGDIVRDMAQRVLGIKVQHAKDPIPMRKVKEALNATSWWHNLVIIKADILNIPFLKQILEEKKPDVVVYDYLSQEHFNNPLRSQQGSAIRELVIDLASLLPDRGIPFITAVQLEKTDKGAFYTNSGWKRRMNFCLEFESAEDSVDKTTRLFTLKVEKNKYGGLSQGSRIRWEASSDTFEMLKVWDATEEIKNEKEEVKKQKAEDRESKKQASLLEKTKGRMEKERLEEEQKTARNRRDNVQ